MVEETDSKPVQCQFESDQGHMTDIPANQMFSEADYANANSRDPREVIKHKLRYLSLDVESSDDVDAVAQQAKDLIGLAEPWGTFYEQLGMRKTRLLGFAAAVAALDITVFAGAINADPAVVGAVMQGYLAQEQGRIDELMALYANGQLPDRPVLDDPSANVIQ